MTGKIGNVWLKTSKLDYVFFYTDFLKWLQYADGNDVAIRLNNFEDFTTCYYKYYRTHFTRHIHERETELFFFILCLCTKYPPQPAVLLARSVWIYSHNTSGGIADIFTTIDHMDILNLNRWGF